MDVIKQSALPSEEQHELNVYRSALAASNGFVFTWDLNSDTIHTFTNNDTLENALDLKNKSTSKRWLDQVHPDDIKQITERNKQLFQNKQAQAQLSYRLRGKDGQWVWLSTYSNIYSYNANGSPSIILGSGNIMSTAKRELEALKQKDQRTKNAFKGTLDTVWDWDLRSGHIDISESWMQQLNLDQSDEELTRELWEKTLHPNDIGHTREALAGVLQNKSDSLTLEHRIRLKDGKYHWTLIHGHVSERDENNKVSHITGVLINIDTLKQQEIILKEQQQTISLAMFSTGSSLIEFDFEQQTFKLSKYTLETGEITLTTQESSLTNAIDNIHPDDHSTFQQFIHNTTCNNSTEVNDTKWRSKLEGGQYRWYQLRAHVTETASNGHAIKAIGIRQDIHLGYQAEYQHHLDYERESVAYRNSLHSVWEFHPKTNYVFFSKHLIKKLVPIGINHPWNNSFDYCSRCIHPDDIGQVIAQLSEQTTYPKQLIDITYRFHISSGEWIWVRAEGKVTERDEQQQATKIIGTLIDITDLKRTENELEKEKELAQTTLESINDAVITTDEHGLVTTLNHKAEQLLRVTQENSVGILLSDICSINEEGSTSNDYSPVQLCLQSDLALNLTKLQLTNQSKQTFYIECSVSPLHAQEKQVIGSVLVIRDVSESRKITHEIEHRAQHDALTGIFNRHAFEAALEENTQADDYIHSLCYIDLDQFKIVNDTCGHVAGDELLRQLSKELSGRIRQSDVFARLGGDEFGVLMLNCPTERAAHIADNLKQTVSEYTFHWEDKTFKLGASIGVAAITPSISSTLALQHADTACFAAKDQGRNKVHVFSFDDTGLIATQGHMSWIPRLHLALKENHFELYAQAITNLQTQASSHLHVEILIRLNENGKIIPPGAFLPAAERYNLSAQIDRWVVENTLHTLRDHQQHIKSNDVFNINLSAASLSDQSFLLFVKNSLSNSVITPSQVCFEITETAAVTNLTAAHELILELKKMGCQFALDDFGSGLSSFGYLKNFPVDYLKIDGAFVKDLIDDPIDAAMVKSINEIGQIMGKKTVAEFVENQAIADKLTEMGVDYAQGYHFSVPGPLGELLLKS